MIRLLLSSFGRMAVPAPAAKGAPGRLAKTILIIDDHAENLGTMCLALAGEAYSVEVADTAQVATRKLSARCPGLILVDSRVPAADGSYLARILLADDDLAKVPIVALNSGPNSYGESGRYDGQIQKPIDSNRFAGQVRDVLDSCHARMARPAGLGLPEEPNHDRRKDAAMMLGIISDGLPDSQFAPGVRDGLHRLAAVVGGSKHFELAEYLRRAERLSLASTVRACASFRSLIRICQDLVEREADGTPDLAALRVGYLEHRRADLNRLEQAVRIGDFEAIRKTGHNLKGTGAAYGFAEITEIGRALEAAARDGAAAAIEILLDRIDAYIGIVRLAGDNGERNVAGS